MKSNSIDTPTVLLSLGDGNYHFNFNVVESEREEEDGNKIKQYDYDTVFIEGKPTMQKIEMAMLADGFTQQEVDSHRAEIEAALADIDNQNN